VVAETISRQASVAILLQSHLCVRCGVRALLLAADLNHACTSCVIDFDCRRTAYNAVSVCVLLSHREGTKAKTLSKHC